ncbi:MAG TPA: hypothetical protein VKR22_04795, partial [Acidimicrobiales bacterium]|nr:hypothetical protein [Acidimicrobiales bacterium]
YFLASSTSIQVAAAEDPNLQLVASTGPWHTQYLGSDLSTTWKVYRVLDSAEVSPLTEQPTVLTGVGAQQGSMPATNANWQSTWLPVAQKWYLDPTQWSRQLVSDGPAGWPRATAAAALARSGTALPPVKVSDISVTSDTIRFHVDRTGVPVLVKTSYFPAWQASGAQGPWRAEPNLMVVVPTSHDVELHYGRTAAGWLGLGLSVVGVVVVVVLVRRRNVAQP